MPQPRCRATAVEVLVPDYGGDPAALDAVLARASTRGNVLVKSGLMLGLGESDAEVRQTLRHLLDHGCQVLTLGQYLQPTRDHLPVAE